MLKQLNKLALISSILTFVVIAASFFVPWWQFSIGSPAFVSLNFSPVNFNFALFNTLMTVPLIWALNIACLLTLLAGGLTLLIYSVLPTKSYSKALLGFGYKKPLYAVILFLAQLALLYISASSLTGLSFPIIGSTMLTLPPSIMPSELNLSVNVSAAFGWTFYLSLVVAGFCIATKLSHRVVEKQSVKTTTQ